MPRKKKDTEAVEKTLFSTTGKIYNKYGAKNIDDILGRRSTPYETADEKEYEAYLATLNKNDLQTHAASLSIKPKDDRVRLTKELVKAFRVKNSVYNNSVEVQGVAVKNERDLLKLLSDGR